jgi:hypothetical protein
MANKSKPSSFLYDLSPTEIEKKLRSVLMNELNERKAMNLPIVYKNSLCISKNQFIHEYPDGRKFLIKQNTNTSEETIIIQL